MHCSSHMFEIRDIVTCTAGVNTDKYGFFVVVRIRFVHACVSAYMRVYVCASIDTQHYVTNCVCRR